MTQLHIRQETSDDQAAIYALTEAAFRDRPYADGDEQDLVDRLRTQGALALSLVAELDGVIVGQVTFSPATLSDGSNPWFALGPISVEPSVQLQGVGSALILRGLADIEALGALGCILTGNPAYYQRFGFELTPEHVPTQESAEFFMVRRLSQQTPTGRFAFHSAFYE